MPKVPLCRLPNIQCISGCLNDRLIQGMEYSGTYTIVGEYRVFQSAHLLFQRFLSPHTGRNLLSAPSFPTCLVLPHLVLTSIEILGDQCFRLFTGVTSNMKPRIVPWSAWVTQDGSNSQALTNISTNCCRRQKRKPVLWFYFHLRLSQRNDHPPVVGIFQRDHSSNDAL